MWCDNTRFGELEIIDSAVYCKRVFRKDKLQAEIARLLIYYGRAAGCWHPQVKNVTLLER